MQTETLSGKVYFYPCEDDSNYYMTVRIGFDPMLRKMTCQISNPVYGNPPEWIPEIDKKTLNAVRSGKLKGLH